MDRRTVLKAATGTAAFGLMGSAFAQEKFPSKTIRMVVPYPPGGVTDLAGRVSSEVLSNKYGQSVVVENRPGANALIGQQYVAGQRPDGYTLMIGGLGSQVLPPATIRNLPLDIPNRFVPIAQIAEFVNILVVKGDSPINSVQELIRHAKSLKEPITYGSNGVGTSAHMTSEYFAMRTGIKTRHIPYKGANEAQVDVATGLVDFFFANLPSALPMTSQGRLKVLAVTSSKRVRQFPNVPTMAEAGVSDFNITSWLGVYGPAGMPKEIVEQLSADIVAGVSQGEARTRLENVGFEVSPMRSAEWDRFNKEELARWSDIAKKAGVSIEFGKG